MLLKRKTYTYGNGGKKILFVCGTHGNEQNAILSTVMLKEMIAADSELVKGATMKFLIGWNEPAIMLNQREYANTDTDVPNDMNRAFSTDESCPTKYQLTEEVSKLVETCDVIIDVHNSLHIKNCILINADLTAGGYVKFAKDNDIAFVLNESRNSTIKKFAIDNGKAGFTVELDNMGFSNDCNEKLNAGAEFLKKLLDSVIKDTAALTKVSKVAINSRMNVVTINSNVSGYLAYRLDSPLGAHYDKHTAIAHVKDYDGNVLETIEAPCDGTIMVLADNLIVDEGGFVAMFQPDFQD